MLGNGRAECYCYDGVTRLGHIRGKMRKKVWVSAGDIVLVGKRDYQDDKARAAIFVLLYLAHFVSCFSRNFCFLRNFSGNRLYATSTVFNCYIEYKYHIFVSRHVFCVGNVRGRFFACIVWVLVDIIGVSLISALDVFLVC